MVDVLQAYPSFPTKEGVVERGAEHPTARDAPAVGPFMRLPFGYTKLAECLESHRRLLPLLPINHADASPQPLVRVGNETRHARPAEIACPSDHVASEVFPEHIETLSATAGREVPEPSLAFRQRLLVGTVADEGFVPLPHLRPEAEAEELQLGICDAADLRFLDVDLQEELSFDEGLEARERTLGGLPASAQNHEVVRVANVLVVTRLQLDIEFVKQDVCQDGADGAALRRPDFPFLNHSVFGHGGAEHLVHEFDDPSILDPLRQNLQKLAVADGVEELCEIDIHHPYASIIGIGQRLDHGR